MIVTKRRQAPRSQNYRGVWSGLGAVPVPNYEQCSPFDSACVARNAALEDAYNLALLSETRQKQLAFCLSDPGYSAVECHKQFDPGGILDQTANAGQGVVTFAAPTPSPASGGRVTFKTSRGNNSLQVGDTWLVSIVGASPNKQVTAKVGTDITPMGTTDSTGSFQLAGTARTADVGAWNETWFVGGSPSGGFSFTVQPAVTSEGKQVINSNGAGSGTGTGGESAAGSASKKSSGSESATKFDFSKIPTWAWVAAVAAAFFVLEAQGGR